MHRRKNIKICFFCLHTWSETFLILRKIKQDIIINVYCYSCKEPRGLFGFEWHLSSLNGFSINPQNIRLYDNMSSGRRVVPCGRTDRQTDMTKPTVAFRIFAKALKKEISFLQLTFAFDKAMFFFIQKTPQNLRSRWSHVQLCWICV
jgi:hypothetical protein